MESRSDAVVAKRSTVMSVSIVSSPRAGAGGIVMRARSGVARIAAWDVRSSAARIGVASCVGAAPTESVGDGTAVSSIAVWFEQAAVSVTLAGAEAEGGARARQAAFACAEEAAAVRLAAAALER
eukprot:3809141-Pleurochrysis_carterae.AAC.1